MEKLKPVIAAVLAAFLATVVAAGAHNTGERHNHGGKELLRSQLAPSVPTDPAIHGVTPGAAPWELKRGWVRLRSRGRLDLRVRGLLIPGDPATTGPVETVSASLYCGPDLNTTPADTTSTEPLSDKGNARIRERIDVPDECLAPTVLVHPNGNTSNYIAAEGWKK